ncbi:hypothetical protein P7C70_g7382, partial [Phenoliferia sp. Uapishka_3]
MRRNHKRVYRTPELESATSSSEASESQQAALYGAASTRIQAQVDRDSSARNERGSKEEGGGVIDNDFCYTKKPLFDRHITSSDKPAKSVVGSTLSLEDGGGGNSTGLLISSVPIADVLLGTADFISISASWEDLPNEVKKEIIDWVPLLLAAQRLEAHEDVARRKALVTLSRKPASPTHPAWKLRNIEEAHRDSCMALSLLQRGFSLSYAQRKLQDLIVLCRHTTDDFRCKLILARFEELSTRRLWIVASGEIGNQCVLDVVKRTSNLQVLFISVVHFKTGTTPYPITCLKPANVQGIFEFHLLQGPGCQFLDAPTSETWGWKVRTLSIGYLITSLSIGNFIISLITSSSDTLTKINFVSPPGDHPDMQTLASLVPHLARINKIQFLWSTPDVLILAISALSTLEYLRINSPISQEVLSRIWGRQGVKGVIPFSELRTLALTGDVGAMRSNGVNEWTGSIEDICLKLRERDGGRCNALPKLATILFHPRVYKEVHRLRTKLAWAPELVKVCQRLNIVIGIFVAE